MTDGLRNQALTQATPHAKCPVEDSPRVTWTAEGAAAPAGDESAHEAVGSKVIPEPADGPSPVTSRTRSAG